MARIPESELEQLKREVSLQRLVEAKGIELKRHGQDLIGLCPFHNDKSPSLVVSPAKNLWHCLGACQAGGSVIDWVMKAEAVSFRHAVELLRKDAPVLSQTLTKHPGRPAQEPRAMTKHTSVRKLDGVLTCDADDVEALGQVVEYYHATLKESPEALTYLQQRGLTHPEMIDHFQLGYANRTLGYHLPMKNRRDGAVLRERLHRLGVLRESGHEHFNGSIVIPLFDAHNRVVSLYGRKVRDDLRPGTPSHLYLPGSRRGVWNLDAFKASDEILLCEALIDALTFWCAGYRNVTTAYGIEGFPDELLDAFKQHEIKRVLIAYDRDEAGEKATEKLAPRLMENGLDCFRVELPRGMDVNDYALASEDVSKSLGAVITQATWLGNGKRPSSVPASTPTAVLDEVSPNASAVPPLTHDTPVSSSPEPIASGDPDELVMTVGPRRWRVRGLAKNTSYEALRVNVLCQQGDAFHVDTLDLYSARQRSSFAKLASLELGIEDEPIKRELGKLLLELEAHQDKRIKALLAPKVELPTMTDAEREEALRLLRDPKLCEHLLQDFQALGVVGEKTNKLVGYIASISRKLQKPLAIIIQSSSAAGKSSLMEAILSFIPEEERVKYSAMTGQSLFYMGETNLKHKVLAIVEEAGAEKASYALKLLQSEGELMIASTGKDPQTGRHVTHEYRVEGPVMILITTTAIDIDEELLNRCLVLTVDEEREQTRAIHAIQRQAHTLEGLLAAEERGQLIALHKNAQRLLLPLLVANPYASELTFLDAQTRTRRDHAKYLGLIDAVALLHQYQRPIQRAEKRGMTVEYIEVTRDDIALANRLAGEVLGRSLDELPPQTRRFLEQLEAKVTEDCTRLGVTKRDYRFGRREVLDWLGLGLTQTRMHLERLVELEYVLTHHGGRGQSFEYELLYDGTGQDGRKFLMNLIDTEQLKTLDNEERVSKPTPTTQSWRGEDGGLAGSYRAHIGPSSGSCRGGESNTNVNNDRPTSTTEAKSSKITAPRGHTSPPPSYRHRPVSKTSKGK